MAEKITENLSTLQIHKLSQAQYEREKAAGRLDPYALYMTPAEEAPGGSGGGTADNTALETHIADKENPHGVTAAQIGAAPINAIVDKSVYMDATVGITWEKRIDGTCTYGNMFEVDVDIDGAREGIQLGMTELDFGFDIYDLEFATHCHESAYEDYLEVKLFIYEDLPNYVGVEVWPKEGLVEVMEDREESWIPVLFDIYITGRWWREE